MRDVPAGKNHQWFEVDRSGLSKLLKRRGIGHALFELLQNAWDAEGVTEVTVTTSYDPVKRLAGIDVLDNSPKGFNRLEDAFTLFAESDKKHDPEKRGRFKLGAKLKTLALKQPAIFSQYARGRA